MNFQKLKQTIDADEQSRSWAGMTSAQLVADFAVAAVAYVEVVKREAIQAIRNNGGGTRYATFVMTGKTLNAKLNKGDVLTAEEQTFLAGFYQWEEWGIESPIDTQNPAFIGLFQGMIDAGYFIASDLIAIQTKAAVATTVGAIAGYDTVPDVGHFDQALALGA